MYNKRTKFDENCWSHFWENENFNFFLMWTTLNFEGRSKTKKQARNICKGTLDIESERDSPVGLGATFGGGQKIKKKTIFPVSGIFPEKADSVILLGFECAINLHNLIKIVKAIFEKFEILIFFLCELPLILRVRGKIKKKREVFARRS